MGLSSYPRHGVSIAFRLNGFSERKPSSYPRHGVSIVFRLNGFLERCLSPVSVVSTPTCLNCLLAFWLIDTGIARAGTVTCFAESQLPFSVLGIDTTVFKWMLDFMERRSQLPFG